MSSVLRAPAPTLGGCIVVNQWPSNGQLLVEGSAYHDALSLSDFGAERLDDHCVRWLQHHHHNGKPQRGTGDLRPRNGVLSKHRFVYGRNVRLLFGQLHRIVCLFPVRDRLLRRQLPAHVPRVRRVHARLLERQVPHLLRRGDVQRRLFRRPLQHVVPARRIVHGELFRRLV